MNVRSLIHDARHQELNIQFSSQKHEDRLIINAHCDHITYQTELKVIPGLDFNDIMDCLEQKIFKFVSKTRETLNLQVGLLKLDFKNVVMMALIELRETVGTLNNRLNEQLDRNNQLENRVVNLTGEMNQVITRVGDLERKVTEQQSKIGQLEEDKTQQANRTRFIERQLNLQEANITEKNALIESLASDIKKLSNQVQKEKGRKEEQVITRVGNLERKVTEQKFQIVLLEEDKTQQTNRIRLIERELNRQAAMITEKNVLIESLASYLEKLQNKVQKEKERKEEAPKLISYNYVNQRQGEKIFVNQVKQGNNVNEQEQIAIVKKQNQLYKFSQKQKGSDIKLDQNDMIVVSQYCNQDVLALVDGAVYKKGSVLRFRVEQVGDSVGFGLGLRKVIEANQFSLTNTDEIGHGCFLLKKDGQALSHSNKENNAVKTGFLFGKGDVIEVETNEKELLVREKSGKWKFSLSIQLSEDDWHQACFCVYLRSNS